MALSSTFTLDGWSVDYEAFLDASAEGNLGRVHELLSHGADPNAKGESGETVLSVAAFAGKADVVAMLLREGADPSTVLDTTGERMHATERDTALGVACFAAKPEIVRILLEARADPNPGDADPPIVSAVAVQSVECIELLLEVGADVNASFGPLKIAALHEAARIGWSDGVTHLLRAGANPAQRDARGQAPAHYANSSGHADLAVRLQNAVNLTRRCN